MSVKVYKYEQYFGRMGSLSSVFAASDKDIKRLKKRGRVYLGEVLGKHSEVTATVDDKTLRELTADPAVVSFFTEHLGGCSGTNLIGHMDDEESDDLRERLRLLKAALRPGEALTDKDGPTVAGHLVSAITKLEREIAKVQMG